MALQHVRMPGLRGRAWRSALARVLPVAIALAGQTGLAVTAAQPAAAATVTLPDMQIKVLTGKISIGTNSSNGHRQLQFTHITWDAGAGPFELDPVFNSTTGTARFNQAIYRSPSPGTWKLDHRVRLAVTGAFELPADYRFPLTRFTLNRVKANGKPGRVIATSPKTEYCMTADTEVGGVPNTPSQSFIPQSNCATPTMPLGWSVGWGDQYDQTDNGQPIDLTEIADGTYYLRATVDPEHLLTESNRNNDVVETKLRISGHTVAVLKQYRPVVRPPKVVLTSPAPGTKVTTAVTLRAKATASAPATVSSVRYLLDGRPIGKTRTTPPYRFRWTVGSTAPGAHWLSARVTDSHGVLGTAPVVKITVVSGASPASAPPLITRPAQPATSAVLLTATGTPPAVSILSPAPGQTVSGTIPVTAVASGGSPVRSLQFFLDGRQLGEPGTAAPYTIGWHTTATSGGNHTLAIRATASDGRASTARVRVRVQNPAPPMTCFVMQAQRNTQGRGVVTTRPFRTVSAGETLLAFVASTGPTGGRPQAVTVSGGGLAWRLAARADRQQGDAEIWEASARKPLAGITVTSAPARPGYRQVLTVIAMEGTAGTGVARARSGTGSRPALSLTTRHDVSLVFAVGTVSGAAGRAGLPAGWVMLRERRGVTALWSQYTNVPVPEAGQAVTVGGLPAGGGRWNLAALEVAGDGS